MRQRGLKSVRENFRRPSGTRLRSPLHPALRAPGYCQSPLRGANPSSLFHCIVRKSVLTQTLKPALILRALRGPFDFAQGRLLKRRSSTVAQANSRFLHSAVADAPAPVGMTKFSNSCRSQSQSQSQDQRQRTGVSVLHGQQQRQRQRLPGFALRSLSLSQGRLGRTAGGGYPHMICGLGFTCAGF
jgi:hypothetical protein